ncbi:MAG: response regulator [Balneolales bacterium]|nr:response regulator [Balneolales bacterium]
MSANPSQVMIVEDDLLLLMVEERLVKNLGYEVVAKASEGGLALRLFREFNPDLLLLDINIRGELTGIDIARQLRKEGSTVPIIFLSGENDHHLVAEAKQVGVVDYLLKPITPAGLKNSLEKASRLAETVNAA